MVSTQLDLKLINLVKNRPCLYNQNTGEKHEIDEQWNEIALCLDKDVEILKARWKTICNRYEIELKKMQTHPKYRSKWMCYKRLRFMNGCINGETYTEIHKQLDSKKLKLNSEIDVQLIELVKLSPMLYDRRDKGYHNIAAKEARWVEIAKKIGENLKPTKTRWKSLRDYYRREERRILMTGCLPCFEHYERLSFIKNFTVPITSSMARRRRGSAQTSDIQEDESPTDDFNDDENDSNYNEIWEPIIEEGQPDANYVKHEVDMVENGETIEARETAAEYNYNSNTFRPDDEKPPQCNCHCNEKSDIKLFFESIAKEVENEQLPFLYVSSIKQGVLKFVHDQIREYQSGDL